MSSRMVTLDSDVFKCCHKVETLGWSNDREAKALLQRAADQVKPIMARRKWAVLLLVEFYPPMPNLLGMNHNHGERIEIRLRSPSNRDAFLPYESILGTLLHELAHIEVGPHNAQFYKLLDELQDECDTLIARGVVPSSSSLSSGTVGHGERLSGGRPPPKHIAQERAVQAANRRSRINRLMMPTGAGGRVLGGHSDLAQLSALCDPREMALAAAQRRMTDDLWCNCANHQPLSSSSSSSATTMAQSDIQSNNEPVVIDVDAVAETGSPKSEVTIVAETRAAAAAAAAPTPARPRPPPCRRRTPSSTIPVRENPAALAALQRAQEQQLRRPHRR